jgi:hypothetical protein
MPKPILLLIVFGLFLVVVGVTTTAQTILVSAHFSNAALTEAVGSDAGTVRTFANLNLLERDLSAGLSPGRRAELARGFAALVRNGNLPGAVESIPSESWTAVTARPTWTLNLSRRPCCPWTA